jgi:hypothetical protein
MEMVLFSSFLTPKFWVWILVGKKKKEKRSWWQV